MRKAWRRYRDAGARAADRKVARAKAERVFAGESRWRPATARAEAEGTYRLQMKMDRAGDRNPRGGADRFRRKLAGRAWSLRKANVTRDPKSGEFRTRRSR